MKKLTTLITLLLCAVTLFAQAPEKFTYQAVVRNANNSLVANTQVGMRVSILQGSANGSAVYVETQTATTNTNGLVTLSIGGGSVQQGTFANIDWGNGPFYLKTETDPNGGSNYTVTTTQQLLSVPYALYAKTAENGFSGDYNDLTNTPQNVSVFNNDAGYINAAQVPAQVNADWNATTGPAEILNKPTIPTVPTNVGAFNNDAGYITMDSVPNVPTNVSAFTNDAGYVTASQCEGLDVCALANLVATLQQQLEDLQAQLDSVGFIIDTAITHTTFSCGTSTVTDIDGNVYNTVQIGNQCWMKENLRTTHYSDSTSIPEGTTLSSTEPYYYDNSNSEIPLLERGYLYNWSAVMHGTDGSSTNPSRVQGICPTGWHVPSDAEWSQLTQYVSEQDNCRCSNDQTYITKALASNTYWNTSTNICAVGNDLSANNATGFSALPAGLINSSGFIYSLDYGTHFWSTTESASDRAWERSLGTAYPYVGRSSNYKRDGYSVRCVRDESTPSVLDQPCPGMPTVTDVDNNVYNTVQIGNQCWMKENLRTTHYSDGTAIPTASSTSETTPRYYDYSSSSIPLTERGYLYNWFAVVHGTNGSSANPSGVQGVCPTGWHVPSHAEWLELETYVSGLGEGYVCGNTPANIAKALASTTGWNNSTTTCAVGNDQSTNNATGFGAFPAGGFGGSYVYSGTYAYLWSATEGSGSTAWHCILDKNVANMSYNSYGKGTGYSVRCVRD